MYSNNATLIFRRYDRTGLVEYRSTHLAYHTLLIKDFPSGGVARITMEAGAPVHYLYFLVQANSDGTSLNECPTKRTLVIPSEQGAFVLDPSWRENEDWLERVKLPSRRVVAAGEMFGGPAGKMESLFSPGSLVAPPPHAGQWMMREYNFERNCVVGLLSIVNLDILRTPRILKRL